MLHLLQDANERGIESASDRLALKVNNSRQALITHSVLFLFPLFEWNKFPIVARRAADDWFSENIVGAKSANTRSQRNEGKSTILLVEMTHIFRFFISHQNFNVVNYHNGRKICNYFQRSLIHSNVHIVAMHFIGYFLLDLLHSGRLKGHKIYSLFLSLSDSFALCFARRVENWLVNFLCGCL